MLDDWDDAAVMRNIENKRAIEAEVCVAQNAESEQQDGLSLTDATQRIAELEAEAAENCRIIGISGEREARHLARIAELEKVAQAYEDQVAAHNKTLDELKYTGLAAAAEAKRGDELQSQVAEQAALIEKCEKALQQVGQALAWLAFGECRSYGEGVPLLGAPDADALCKEALAAITTYKGEPNDSI